MVPINVVTSRDDIIRNGGCGIAFTKGFEMFSFSVTKSSGSFVNLSVSYEASDFKEALAIAGLCYGTSSLPLDMRHPLMNSRQNWPTIIS